MFTATLDYDLESGIEAEVSLCLRTARATVVCKGQCKEFQYGTLCRRYGGNQLLEDDDMMRRAALQAFKDSEQ